MQFKNLGKLTTKWWQGAEEPGTLGDVSGDLLGRVFDVFLCKFRNLKVASKCLLNANPVKQAMVEMAIHDLSGDDAFMARFSNGDFRFGGSNLWFSFWFSCFKSIWPFDW